jgi:UDP-GlcNAc:undecaprenyl-phosphate GlcNAc-1-phosphate transferase
VIDALRGWLDNVGPSYPTAFLVAAVTTVVLVPAVRRLAVARGVVDKPDLLRRVHTRVTPRWGGIAIAAGFFASLMVLWLLDTGVARFFARDLNRVLVIFGGGLAMLGLGVYDDARGANAVIKLSVQIPAALLLPVLGFSFDVVALPWGGNLYVGPFGSLLAVLWVVGVTNAINLIDGLDGLAAGVAFVAVAVTFVIGVAGDKIIMALVSVALAGALLGFLFHNFHPANIFMGDAGSLFIGYVVAATSVMANFKSQTTVALAVPVLLLGLPILDTSLAFFRRMLRGRSPLSADRDHVHHRLLAFGLSHRNVVLVMWGFSLLCASATLAVYFSPAKNAVWILLVYGVIVLVLARRLGYVRMERWRAEFRDGREAKRVRRARVETVRTVADRVRQAASVDEAFHVLTAAHALYGYDEVQLEVHAAEAPQNTVLDWRRPTTKVGAGAEAFEVTFDLDAPGAHGRISYRYRDGRRGIEVEDESLLRLLHQALRAPLERQFGAR